MRTSSILPLKKLTFDVVPPAVLSVAPIYTFTAETLDVTLCVVDTELPYRIGVEQATVFGIVFGGGDLDSVFVGIARSHTDVDRQTLFKEVSH